MAHLHLAFHLFIQCIVCLLHYLHENRVSSACWFPAEPPVPRPVSRCQQTLSTYVWNKWVPLESCLLSPHCFFLMFLWDCCLNFCVLCSWSSSGIVGKKKTVDSHVQLKLTIWLFHLQAVWLGTSHLTSLSFHFFAYKIWKAFLPPTQDCWKGSIESYVKGRQG